MTLILKSQTVGSASQPKFYRDALVSDGTIILVDHSNGGSFAAPLAGGTVYNLAREAAVDLGLPALNMDFAGTPSFTAGGGFYNLGGSSNPNYQVDLTALSIYLYAEQPAMLFTAWLRSRDNTNDSVMIDGTSDNSTPHRNFRLYAVNSGGGYKANWLLMLASKGYVVTADNASLDLMQIALYRSADGTTFRGWVNGAEITLGSPTGSGVAYAESTGMVLGVGVISTGTQQANGAANLYRWGLEDITVSGRDPAAVVLADYEYVTGTGRYAHVAPRSFVETI